MISNSSGPFRRIVREFGPVRSGPFHEIVYPVECTPTSTHWSAVSASSGLPQNYRRPAALPHPAHSPSHLSASHQPWIPLIHPNTYSTADDTSNRNDHKCDSTQLTFHDQPHQPPGSPSSLHVQLLSLLHHSPTISYHCHWRGSTVVEHVI